MTVKECAIVEAYTGIVMCAGGRRKYIYEYVSKLLGRPVFTHEFYTLADEIKELSKEDFISLCKSATQEDGTGWIPVKERLPDGNCDVLVSCDSGSVCVGFDYGGCNFADSNECIPLDVQAWMPLPEPYKKEN